MNSPENQFLDAIRSAGYTQLSEIIADGKIHRFSTNDDHKDTAGWYCLYLDDHPAGAFGDWRTGYEATWSSPNVKFSPGDRHKHHARLAYQIQERKKEDDLRRIEAEKQANQIWNDASHAPKDHPYLIKKEISPEGARISNDSLVLPLRDVQGILRSLQFIKGDGTKRFLYGGAVQGNFYTIAQPDDMMFITEGFATGATISELTGKAVAVCFSATNIKPVAKAIRGKYPKLKLVIAADDDWKTAGNPGISKAHEAAKEVSGFVSIPNFGSVRSDDSTDFNDLKRLQGVEVTKRCLEIASFPDSPLISSLLSVNFDWGTPQSLALELPSAPKFEPELLLTPVLRDFVLDESERMPCSPDFIAATLIVSLGSVIGTTCALKPKSNDDWIVTPNLFGGVIGYPASKKSGAVSSVTGILDRLDAKGTKELEAEMLIYKSELAAFEAHQFALKKTLKNSLSEQSNKVGLEDVKSEYQILQEPQAPFKRRFKTNDATIQKLGEILAKNHQGILVLRDELSGLFASWEKKGAEEDKAFYLEGWNGLGSFNIDRIGRGSTVVKTLCLSVFGGIQPDLLEKYLSGITEGLSNDGGIQRFQVLVFPEPTPWKWVDRTPSHGVRESIRAVFERLATFDPVQDGAYSSNEFVKVPFFKFDDEAQKLYSDWCTDLYLNQIASESTPLMQQHLGKYEKLFCAVALILHLSSGEIGQVKKESAERALEWCKYLAAHARRIYSLSGSARVGSAQALARHLKNSGLKDGFTVRDVERKNWSALKTPAAINSAIAILEERGWLKGVDDSENKVGRQTTRYFINPAVVRSS